MGDDSGNKYFAPAVASEDTPQTVIVCRCGQKYYNPYDYSMHLAVSGHWASKMVSKKDKHNEQGKRQ